MIGIMSDPISDLFSDAAATVLDLDQHVFLRGDPVRAVFLLVKGRVDLIRVSETGTQMSLQRAGPGDVVAEASIYSDHYHCDGIVRQPGQMRAVPIERFRTALHDDPDLHRIWAARLAMQVQKARVLAEIRGVRRLKDRLDMWLAEGNPLPEKGRQQDLAAELGVSREALYRELARRRR